MVRTNAMEVYEDVTQQVAKLTGFTEPVAVRSCAFGYTCGQLAEIGKILKDEKLNNTQKVERIVTYLEEE